MQSESVARSPASKPLPAVPKKPLPKPPATIQDPVSNKIAEEIAFAFHQTSEFIKQYATNLHLIQLQPENKITNGLLKTIRVSEQAMRECLVPLIVSRPEITHFDCTWIALEPGSLVSFLNASAKHALKEIWVSRAMTPAEKVALQKNLKHLHGRCQSKKARSAYVKYVINPTYNTQQAFSKTIYFARSHHRNRKGSCPCVRYFVVRFRPQDFVGDEDLLSHDLESAGHDQTDPTAGSSKAAAKFFQHGRPRASRSRRCLYQP